MARYNVAIYGTGVKYGASQQAEFLVEPGTFLSTSNLLATGTGNYIIRWRPVGGVFTAFRLVRNFQNTPSDENDGDIRSTTNTGVYAENGLPQGSFVYYSIFVQDGTGEWFRSGDLTILVTRDWGYSDRLFELLPQFIQARDDALIDPDSPLIASNPEMATKGPLRRFLQLPGNELDVIRTEYETLRLANDVRNVAGGLLPLLAKSLGLEYEAELGMRRNREFIENAIHYYKLKGTQPGVKGITTAVSGWDAEVTLGGSRPRTAIAAAANGLALPQATIPVDSTTGYPTSGSIDIFINGSPVRVAYTGLAGNSFTGCTGGTGTLATGQGVYSTVTRGNLLLDTRDASFVLGPTGAVTAPYGTWQPIAGNGVISLTDETAQGFTSAISNYDAQFLRIVGAGGIGTQGTLRGGYIPVGGLNNVVFSIYQRSDAAGSGGSVGIAFFDKHLQQISTATTGYTSDAAWSRFSHTAAVPANAFYARPLFSYENFTARTHFIDFAQFESGTAPTMYESPRTIHIKLRANRVNMVQNPSAEAGLFGWSALTNATLTRSTAQHKDGVAAFSLASTAAGAMQAGTGLMPVTAGLRYAASAYFLAATTLQSVGVSIVWVAANGTTIINTIQSPDELEVATNPVAWVRPGVVGIAPIGATQAYLLVRVASTSAAGEVHYFDSALFEQADSVKDYFDASRPSTTGEFLWENGGAAHTVPSHFYSKRLLKRVRLLQVLPDYLPAAASFTLEFAKNP